MALVSTKARRAERRARSPKLGPVALSIMVSGLDPLSELGDWEPVGSLVEEIRLVLRGNDGLSAMTIARAQRWPVIWSALRAEVRAFYVKALTTKTLNERLYATATAALIHVLDERPSDLKPHQYRNLEIAYRELYNHDSPFVLVPRATRRSS